MTGMGEGKGSDAQIAASTRDLRPVSWEDEYWHMVERFNTVLGENERLRRYVAVIASGMPREDLLAIEREFGEPVDGRLPGEADA